MEKSTFNEATDTFYYVNIFLTNINDEKISGEIKIPFTLPKTAENEEIEEKALASLHKATLLNFTVRK